MIKKYFAQHIKSFFKDFKITIVSTKNINSFSIGPAIKTIYLLAIFWLIFSTYSFFKKSSLLYEKEVNISDLKLINNQLGNKIDEIKAELEEAQNYFNLINNYEHFISFGKELDPQNSKKNSDITYLSSYLSKYNDAKKTIKLPKTIDNDTLISLSESKKIIEALKSESEKRIKTLQDAIFAAGINANDIIREELLSGEYDIRENLAKGGPFIDETENNTNSEEELLEDILTHQKQSLIENNQETFAKNIQYLKILESYVNDLPFQQAIQNEPYYISSGFGKRIDPFNNKMANHRGIDLVGKKRSKIKATSDGTVILAGKYGAYGNAIKIDHGNNIKTLYAHLSKINVSKGDKIKRGDVIGLQGSSGRSSGDHLHYEIIVNGEKVDPIKFLNLGKKVKARKKV